MLSAWLNRLDAKFRHLDARYYAWLERRIQPLLDSFFDSLIDAWLPLAIFVTLVLGAVALLERREALLVALLIFVIAYVGARHEGSRVWTAVSVIVWSGVSLVILAALALALGYGLTLLSTALDVR